ncbi:hypothetical protein R3P38DRAFT_717609 [Favolaschia claudopus]|uniref:Uncharacterized protein n=1 Tax=Favolaschia claudopus TaxID=2862362 RepID=A0AAV9Z6H6_9AGAR
MSRRASRLPRTSTYPSLQDIRAAAEAIIRDVFRNQRTFDRLHSHSPEPDSLLVVHATKRASSTDSCIVSQYGHRSMPAEGRRNEATPFPRTIPRLSRIHLKSEVLHRRERGEAPYDLQPHRSRLSHTPDNQTHILPHPPNKEESVSHLVGGGASCTAPRVVEAIPRSQQHPMDHRLTHRPLFPLSKRKRKEKEFRPRHSNFTDQR